MLNRRNGGCLSGVMFNIGVKTLSLLGCLFDHQVQILHCNILVSCFVDVRWYDLNLTGDRVGGIAESVIPHDIYPLLSFFFEPTVLHILGLVEPIL